MSAYRDNRVKAGLSNQVSIDPCIVGEIQELWGKGIHTRGCCCGHNMFSSFVNVTEDCIGDMLDMGYIQEHHFDKNRKDTFRLKTTAITPQLK